MLVDIESDVVDRVVVAGLKEQYGYLVDDMKMRAIGAIGPINAKDPVVDVAKINEMRLAMRVCIRYFSPREDWMEWKQENPKRIKLEWKKYGCEII